MSTPNPAAPGAPAAPATSGTGAIEAAAAQFAAGGFQPAPSADAAGDDGKPLGLNGEKALKAEREARAAAEKASAALQKQLDDIAAASLSDLEKAQKAAKDAQEAAAKATTEAFREAAVKFGGISQEDAELFLTGTDKDTLQKQAARLVEKWTADQATQNPSVPGPRPDLTQAAQSALPLNSDGLTEALARAVGAR
jgi:hypothetical protein